MFSGIVEQLGVVTACEPCEFGSILYVDPAGWVHQPAAGDSMWHDVLSSFPRWRIRIVCGSWQSEQRMPLAYILL